MGLMDLSGNVLLPNEYRSVELVDSKNQVYQFNSPEDKSGLYFLKDHTILPCEYDDIKYKSGIYFMRKGSLWGWLIPVGYGENNFNVTIAPQFDNFKKVDDRTLIVSKNGLNGAVDLFDPKNIIVPIQINHDIEYSEKLGFFYRIYPDTTAAILRDTTLLIPSNEFIIDNNLISYFTKDRAELYVHDDTTGELIRSYTNNFYKIDWYYYDRQWKCIVHNKDINFRKHQKTLIDPFTGKEVYSILLKGNERLTMTGFEDARYLNATARIHISWHRGGMEYDKYVGQLIGYTYVSNEQPIITKKPYPRGGSNGKKPFFMPGKD